VSRLAPRPALLAPVLIGALGCVAIVVEADEAGDDSETSAATETSSTTSGDGDGDPTSSGDGDPTGSGDGDPTSSGDGDGDPMLPPSFRVVVLADLHVPGPDYDGGDTAIELARDHLLDARDKIAAIDPPPAFAVVIGDLVHDAYGSQDELWYQTNPNAFADVDDILAGFPIPVYPVYGDSDYAVPKFSKQLSHLLFAQLFATDPYYSVDHLGWRFVFTNSQIGQTFDEGTNIYDTSRGSYGDAQLNWIRSQLDADLPTVLFTHFPLFDVAEDDNPDGAYTNIEAAIADADRLALILSGHGHSWSELPATYAAPHISFGATYLDSDNFLLIEFTTEALQYQILDKDKPNWGSEDAETWIYDGPPMPGG